MNLFRHRPAQRPAQNLSEWLDIATRGIAFASDQARVRAEIEMHYAEAVAAQLKSGLTEPAAQAAALADLGDAHAAARRFRREHLTENDSKQVARWILYAQSKVLLTFWCVFYPIWLWSIMSSVDLHRFDFSFEAAFSLLLSIMLIGFRIAVYILARRKTTPAILRRIFFVNLICVLIFLVPTLMELPIDWVAFLRRCFGVGMSDAREYFFAASFQFQQTLVLMWFISMALNLHSLRKKLPSDGEDLRKMPLRDSSTA